MPDLTSTQTEEAQAQGERKTKRARGMAPKPSVVPEHSMMPEPSVLPEPEDVPIPDEDLVIEILADQMIDFDESSTDVLEIFAVPRGDKKRVEVNERRMTDEDRTLFRRATQSCRRGWITKLLTLWTRRLLTKIE